MTYSGSTILAKRRYMHCTSTHRRVASHSKKRNACGHVECNERPKGRVRSYVLVFQGNINTLCRFSYCLILWSGATLGVSVKGAVS